MNCNEIHSMNKPGKEKVSSPSGTAKAVVARAVAATLYRGVVVSTFKSNAIGAGPTRGGPPPTTRPDRRAKS